MEYRLKLRPDVTNTRSMSTSTSMSDGMLYYSLSSMWQHEKPSRSLWDVSLAQQVKFAMPIMPRIDAFGKAQSVLVGGFVGSKSQRPEKPDLFPIGNLISSCIQNHVQKSLAPSQAQLMQAVMANLLLPEKTQNCRPSDPNLKMNGFNGCKTSEPNLKKNVDDCKADHNIKMNGCKTSDPYSKMNSFNDCKTSDPNVKINDSNSDDPHVEMNVTGCQISDPNPNLEINGFLQTDPNLKMNGVNAPLKNFLEEGCDSWMTAADIPVREKVVEKVVEDSSNKMSTKDGSDVRVGIDTSSANFAIPANLGAKESGQEPKENGVCNGNSCKEPCPQDLASSCKKMCQIASQCLGALLSDFGDEKENGSQSANDLNEIMNTCLDVIFPQQSGCASTHDSATKNAGSFENIPELVGNCLDAILKESTPSVGRTENHASLEDFKKVPELALNAAMSLLSESGNAQLTNACMRLLSECSVDSDDSDFIIFGDNNCALESEDDDEWTESDCDDDDEDVTEDDPIREAYRKWTEFYGESPPQSPSETFRQVRFNPKPKVHEMIAWDYASRQARIGPWEQAARDRVRFKQRIQRTEAEISAVFTPAHRTKIWRRMQEQTQLPSS